MHLYNKEDLARLKDSKPIQITAHTHECIVPVVYSGMVNRFLEKKGVHLPLTHHQLADMKREAGTPGYAKGTKDLKKGKKKGKKKEAKAKAPLINQSVNVTVTSGSKSSASASGGGGSGGAGGKGSGGVGGRGGGGGMGGGGGGGGDKARALYSQLRPSNYATIRSASLAPQQIYPTIDYGKEAREAKAKESEALEHYKKELETRTKQMERLEATMADVLKAKEPLYKPESVIPLRVDDSNQQAPASYQIWLEQQVDVERLRREREQQRQQKEAERQQKEAAAESIRLAKLAKKQEEEEEKKQAEKKKGSEGDIRKYLKPKITPISDASSSAQPAVSTQPAQPAVSIQPAQPAVSAPPKKRGRKKQAVAQEP